MNATEDRSFYAAVHRGFVVPTPTAAASSYAPVKRTASEAAAAPSSSSSEPPGMSTSNSHAVAASPPKKPRRVPSPEIEIMYLSEHHRYWSLCGVVLSARRIPLKSDQTAASAQRDAADTPREAVLARVSDKNKDIVTMVVHQDALPDTGLAPLECYRFSNGRAYRSSPNRSNAADSNIAALKESMYKIEMSASLNSLVEPFEPTPEQWQALDPFIAHFSALQALGKSGDDTGNGASPSKGASRSYIVNVRGLVLRTALQQDGTGKENLEVTLLDKEGLGLFLSLRDVASKKEQLENNFQLASTMETQSIREKLTLLLRPHSHVGIVGALYSPKSATLHLTNTCYVAHLPLSPEEEAAFPSEERLSLSFPPVVRLRGAAGEYGGGGGQPHQQRGVSALELKRDIYLLPDILEVLTDSGEIYLNAVPAYIEPGPDPPVYSVLCDLCNEWSVQPPPNQLQLQDSVVPYCNACGSQLADSADDGGRAKITVFLEVGAHKDASLTKPPFALKAYRYPVQKFLTAYNENNCTNFRLSDVVSTPALLKGQFLLDLKLADYRKKRFEFAASRQQLPQGCAPDEWKKEAPMGVDIFVMSIVESSSLAAGGGGEGY